MNRILIAYLSSYGVSMLGNASAAIVLPLVVLQTTGSALDAGVVAAATAVPAVLAGLFMGGVVDRFNRRAVSIVTDVISAVAIAALPVVGLVSELSVGWFVLFGILGSFGDVPGLTAREALLLPVARHSGTGVDRLVGLREGISAMVLIIGPAAGAGLVTLFDAEAALWATAGLSLVAALITVALPRDVGIITDAPVGRSVRASFAHLREGWSLLFVRSPLLLSVTLLNLLLATVLTAVQGLILPVHFTVLGQEGRLGLVLSSLAVGMLVGSAVYASVGTSLSRRTWLIVGLLGSTVGIALIGALPPVGLVFAGAAILGFFGGVVSIVLGVVMTERIPEAARGRVLGTQNAVITAAPSLGILGAGVLIESTSITTAGATVAAVWLVTVAIALLVRPLRDLDPQQTAETTPATPAAPASV